MDKTNSKINISPDSAYPFLLPFDYSNILNITERNLPHWQQDKATYFATFRLADSLPSEKLEQIRTEQTNWLRHHNKPYSLEELAEYNELFNQRIQSWLDSGHGACLLKDGDISNIIEDSLAYFAEERYLLHEWVIIPNHIHLLLTPTNGFTLDKLLHSLKSYTSNKINKTVGRSGKLWKDESYDHIVRNARQFRAIRKYILMNPLKAGLKSRYRISSKEPEQEIQRHRQDACVTL